MTFVSVDEQKLDLYLGWLQPTVASATSQSYNFFYIDFPSTLTTTTTATNILISSEEMTTYFQVGKKICDNIPPVGDVASKKKIKNSKKKHFCEQSCSFVK